MRRIAPIIVFDVRGMRLEKIGPASERPLTLVELPEPEPAPGEIAIRVDACGVCRTDLHIVEGEVEAALPVVPGHQAAGRVERVGAGVSGFSHGDPVGVGWMASTCGICRFCVSGRENLCERAAFTGRDRDGGYAEWMTAAEGWVYPLPSGFSSREAAPLLCAGIIGYRSLKISGIRPGGRLGLFGFGASAHLAIQVARSWGCEVFAFTREAHHRGLARALGAVWSGEAREDPGVLLDAAITIAPAGEQPPRTIARPEAQLPQNVAGGIEAAVAGAARLLPDGQSLGGGRGRDAAYASSALDHEDERVPADRREALLRRSRGEPGR